MRILLTEWILNHLLDQVHQCSEGILVIEAFACRSFLYFYQFFWHLEHRFTGTSHYIILKSFRCLMDSLLLHRIFWPWDYSYVKRDNFRIGKDVKWQLPGKFFFNQNTRQDKTQNTSNDISHCLNSQKNNLST